MINVAKEHTKVEGLGKFGLALQHIQNLAKDGIVTGNREYFITIRDKAVDYLADLAKVESEMEKLDKDSPCLKCTAIGRG